MLTSRLVNKNESSLHHSIYGWIWMNVLAKEATSGPVQFWGQYTIVGSCMSHLYIWNKPQEQHRAVVNWLSCNSGKCRSCDVFGTKNSSFTHTTRRHSCKSRKKIFWQSHQIWNKCVISQCEPLGQTQVLVYRGVHWIYVSKIYYSLNYGLTVQCR